MKERVQQVDLKPAA